MTRVTGMMKITVITGMTVMTLMARVTDNKND